MIKIEVIPILWRKVHGLYKNQNSAEDAAVGKLHGQPTYWTYHHH